MEVREELKAVSRGVQTHTAKFPALETPPEKAASMHKLEALTIKTPLESFRADLAKRKLRFVELLRGAYLEQAKPDEYSFALDSTYSGKTQILG